MRNVALAGKSKEPETVPLPQSEDERVGRPVRRGSEVSSTSSVGSVNAENEEFQEARDNFDEEFAPPQPQFPVIKAHSPARDSKFIEAI